MVMQNSDRIFPRQTFHDFSVKLIDGQKWQLSQQSAQSTFTLLVFYRGLHCPICAKYLADLERRLVKFNELDVSVIAISSDTHERALQTRDDWELKALTIGYDFDLHSAKNLGLYLSNGKGKTSIGIEEPERFIEPGLFVVRSDQTLYFSSIQTMPFARPNFAEVAGALEFVINNSYPARGEITSL